MVGGVAVAVECGGRGHDPRGGGELPRDGELPKKRRMVFGEERRG